MDKSIIMIDGGFFKKKFKKAKSVPPNAIQIKEFVENVYKKHCKNFELLRIYFYDCPPAKGVFNNPISQKPYDLESTRAYSNGVQLLQDLKRTDFFAVRAGSLNVHGWKLKDNVKPNKSGAFQESDYRLNMQQKGVDIKIGIDIAWISFQQIAQRIVIITGDSDFIPAIKLARRQGIQVILLTLDHGVYCELKNNVDVLDELDIKNYIT